MSTSQQYYTDTSKHGQYQFVNLSDIINNFMLMYVGDEKIINDIPRYQVIHHAKRAIQELNYNAFKETVQMEIELGSNLKIVMPEDFVQLVKVSFIDEFGRLYPMTENPHNAIPKAFLQDNNADFTFDSNGDLQQSTSLSETRMAKNPTKQKDIDSLEDEHSGGRYGMETSLANKNGRYLIDKKSGFIKFSSDLKDGDIIVLEYISDGLFGATDTTIKINKLAEDYLYAYLQATILESKFGVQEYIVRRTQKAASAKLKNAKIRLMNINIDNLVQRLKGKNKWIK
tara:strand:- start:713 stop:1567 length:855 start_codon:yes stop_codon:yes gene_type:complete